MKKSFVLIVSLVLFVAMVGGCSSQKPSPSPKPEPIPLPKPEPEPEPEPLWNFDEEELVIGFLGKTYDEIAGELGDPIFQTPELGEYYWNDQFVYFNEEGVSYKFSVWIKNTEIFGAVIEQTSLEELLSLHGEEEEYSEKVNEDIPEFCTYSYGYRWRAIWGQVERLFKVTFHSDYQNKIKGVEVELLP